MTEVLATIGAAIVFFWLAPVALGLWRMYVRMDYLERMYLHSWLDSHRMFACRLPADQDAHMTQVARQFWRLRRLAKREKCDFGELLGAEWLNSIPRMFVEAAAGDPNDSNTRNARALIAMNPFRGPPKH